MMPSEAYKSSQVSALRQLQNTPSSHAHALAQQATARTLDALLRFCGVPATLIEHRSLERRRSVELRERCARGQPGKERQRSCMAEPDQREGAGRGSREEAEQGGSEGGFACGECGGTEDQLALDPDTAWGLSAVAETEPLKVSELLAAWPAYRRGAGMGRPITAPPLSAADADALQVEGRDGRRGAAGPSACPLVSEFDEREPWEWNTRLTFSIFMQYFRQPKILDSIVESYARCMKGVMPPADTAPDAPDIPFELLANVDQPGEAEQWVQQWRRLNYAASAERGSKDPTADLHGISVREHKSKRSNARNPSPSTYLPEPVAVKSPKFRTRGFLFVVFNHNFHEIRGYNFLARAATGDVLVLAQDDDLAPQNCSWLSYIARHLDIHPQTAGVSYRGSMIVSGPRFHSMTSSYFDHFQTDPATGALAEFTQRGDIGPILFLSCSWVGMGGLDEAFSLRGESGIISDWHISDRLWLSGKRMIALFTPHQLSERPSGVDGTTHNLASLSNSHRILNSGMNNVVMAPMDGFEKDLFLEVVRVSTGLMRPQEAPY